MLPDRIRTLALLACLGLAIAGLLLARHIHSIKHKGVAVVGIRAQYPFPYRTNQSYDVFWFSAMVNSVREFANQSGLQESAAAAAGIFPDQIRFLDIQQFRSTSILQLRYETPSQHSAEAFATNLAHLFCNEAGKNFLVVPYETEPAYFRSLTRKEQWSQGINQWWYETKNRLFLP